MVKVIYKKEDGIIDYINITGHADFDEYGSDIVCAGISMVSYTIANKLLNIDENFNLIINENEFSFSNNEPTSSINLLMETLLEGMFLVKDQYEKYIEIKEV